MGLTKMETRIRELLLAELDSHVDVPERVARGITDLCASDALDAKSLSDLIEAAVADTD